MPQFRLTFKKGPKVVAEIEGLEENAIDAMPFGQVAQGILDFEHFAEKLTGLRLHVEELVHEVPEPDEG